MDVPVSPSNEAFIVTVGDPFGGPGLVTTNPPVRIALCVGLATLGLRGPSAAAAETVMRAMRLVGDSIVTDVTDMPVPNTTRDEGANLELGDPLMRTFTPEAPAGALATVGR